jgi:hypothetical protein
MGRGGVYMARGCNIDLDEYACVRIIWVAGILGIFVIPLRGWVGLYRGSCVMLI